MELLGFALAVVGGLLLYYIGLGLYRERIVTRLTEIALGKPTEYEFALFLRPFSIDNAASVATEVEYLERDPWSHSSAYPGFSVQRRKVEDSVAEHVRRFTRGKSAAALARPGGGLHFDILQLSAPDANWQTYVTNLAAASRWIFFLPFPTQATLWELDLINQKALWAKTILVMPNEGMLPADAASVIWREVSRLLRGHGVNVPPYRKEGGFLLSVQPGHFDLLLSMATLSRYNMSSLSRMLIERRKAIAVQ